MNILFLTVSAGSGHIKAAESIQETVKQYYPDSNTHLIDAYKYASPLIDKLVIGGYLKTLKNSPKLWGKIYELAEKDSNVNELTNSLNKILSYKIKKLLSDFKPDVIVCTHPFPLQMACSLKKKGIIDVPIVNIITDYATHKSWINEYVDAYIVAHEMLTFELIERGVQKDKIHSFGIPVGNKFLNQKDRKSILRNYNLGDKPTYLIMGGSLGIGKIKVLFSNLIQSPKDIQIIIVCGNNIKLKKQLEKIYQCSKSNKNVLILGYTNEINDLMSISDALITKPGGLTIAEALIAKVPLVIFSPIPGQEEKNANFLLNNGAAIRLERLNKFDSNLFQYIENPLRISHMKEMYQYLAKPNSSQKITVFLNKLSQDSN